MPSFKGLWSILGSFRNLIFAHCSVVLQRMRNLWRRRPKDGSLQVFKKAKDRSLKPFHVQAHAEFALVLNSVDLWVFGCVFVRVWCFRLSISYQFGMLLYFRVLDVKIELNISIGSWLNFYDRLLVFCGDSELFCVIFGSPISIVFVFRLGAVV